MGLSWVRVARSPVTGVLMRKLTGRRPCGDRRGHSQGPGAPRSWKGQEGFTPWSPWRELHPAHSWISDFWPPEVEESKFCCFKPQVCGSLSLQPQDTDVSSFPSFYVFLKYVMVKKTT